MYVSREGLGRGDIFVRSKWVTDSNTMHCVIVVADSQIDFEQKANLISKLAAWQLSREIGSTRHKPTAMAK